MYHFLLDLFKTVGKKVFPISDTLSIAKLDDDDEFWAIGMTGKNGTARRGEVVEPEPSREPEVATADRIGADSIWKAGWKDGAYATSGEISSALIAFKF